MYNVIEKISYHRKMSVTRKCQTHSLWSQPFTFPIFSLSSSSPWYICFFLFYLLRDYQIVKDEEDFFYHHFLVLLARISHYKASECEMKKIFLRRSCDIRIYVITQLLPFIYSACLLCLCRNHMTTRFVTILTKKSI